MRTSSKTQDWRIQMQRLYLVSFIGWAVATSLVLYAWMFQNDGRWYVSSANMLMTFMLVALPGMLYFLLRSSSLKNAKPESAAKIVRKIMVVQHITGISGMIGAVVGLLPFLVNFGAFVMGLSDLLMNIGMIAAWTSLYGFMVTYIWAMVINRKRRKAASS